MKRLVFCFFFLFLGLMECQCVKSVNQEIRTGETLVKLVEEEDYDKIFSLLDKIALRGGGTLKVKCWGVDALSYLGATYSVCVYDVDGKRLSNNFEEDFWSYLQVKKSKMGAWQAYLLDNMWRYLPLYDHANYFRRSYVYSKSSKIELEGVFDDEESSFNQAISVNDVTPSIERKGDEFFISACYWTVFGGLCRQNCVVKFDSEKVSIKYFDSDVLFEYYQYILY